jgi:hypothetical protein
VNTDDQSSMEDRVRTATRAGASLIRDVPPLAAPAPARLRRRPSPAPRRWVNWGVPLAAAAAVVAIALTLVAVRQPGTPSPAASVSPAASASATASAHGTATASGTATPSGTGSASPSATASGTAAPATIPRYYAIARGYDVQSSRPEPLIVGDDLTGTVIDTISAPAGLVFTNVRGTSDDRTFIVEAAVNTPPYGAPPYSWYLLRLAPGSAHPYQLTKLPIKLPGSRTFALAYALSPDGRELAVESADDSAKGKPLTLAIYSVSTGAQLHAWTVDEQQISRDTSVGPLSWLSDGRHLVVSALAGSAQDMQLRTLDVSATGTDLMADSQALFTADSSEDCASLQVTPDGGTVICPAQAGSPGASVGSAGGCAYGALRFTAFPLPDEPSGKPARVLYQYPGTCHYADASLVWTNASASSIVGVMSIDVTSKSAVEVYETGVITGGRFQPLNIAKSILPDEYGDLVF